jgi:predicted ATPase
MITNVPGAPEVGTAYSRARALCRQVGETPQLFPALRGLWEFYQIRGELETARPLANELLTLAQRGHDSVLRLEAHSAQWQTLVPLGEFIPAREHLEQGLTLYNPAQHRSHPLLYAWYDPGVSCRGYMARALWALGYPDQALKRSHEAVTLAQELSHPGSLALALAYALVLHQLRGEEQAIQERAEAAVAFYAEQGFPTWLAMGTIVQGWALAERGQAEKGLAHIRQGLATWQAAGAELYVPLFLGALAQAYAHSGQAEEGLRVIAEALAIVEKNEERWIEAELYRLKGELTLQHEKQKAKGHPGPRRRGKKQKARIETDPYLLTPDPQAEAEAFFSKAIAIAHRQHAKSLELRATVSLARLWQPQGKVKEARQRLTEIYGWFTEGLNTKDLQEAKALLEELT